MPQNKQPILVISKALLKTLKLQNAVFVNKFSKNITVKNSLTYSGRCLYPINIYKLQLFLVNLSYIYS